MKHFLLFAAALPPPIHGQSAVTYAVLEKLESRDALYNVINLSPLSLRRSLKYHFTRLKSYLTAISTASARAHIKRKTVYTVIESGLGVFYSILFLVICKIFRYKIIVHHHTAHYLLKRRFLHGLLFQLLGPDTTHVVLSTRMGSDLRKKYNSAKRIIISHNASYIHANHEMLNDTSSRILSLKTEERDLKIGFIGNISAEKGLDLAIDLVVDLNANGIAAKLVIAGPTATLPARKLVDEGKRRLGFRCEWLGSLHGVQKAKFFHEVDWIIFPSKYKFEAQPLVVLEAMMFGVPILATNVGYIGELLPSSTVFPVENFRYAAFEYILESTREIDRRINLSIDNRHRFLKMKLTANMQQSDLIERLVGLKVEKSGD